MISQPEVMKKYGVSKWYLDKLVAKTQLTRLVPGVRRAFFDETQVIKVLGRPKKINDLIFQLAEQTAE